MKITKLYFLVLFAFGIFASCDSSDPNTQTRLIIHHTNDIFGYLEPCG